jgi:regulator of sirC expression with transglutaminase-like and TPR domain
MDKELKTLHKLVNLLDVSDDEAYEEVASQILAFGPDVIHLLEREWMKLPDTQRQNRLLHLIQKLHLEKIYQQLTIWSSFYPADLYKGFIIVSQYLYSDLETEQVEEQLSKIRDDLRQELHENLTALQKIKVINHILFDVHRYRVNLKKDTFVESHFLKHLLDNKKGAPIALGILYMTLAQEFGIPLYGLLLSHHFILAYMHADFPGAAAFNSDVRFYLNPHFKGAIFTAREIRKYLEETQQTPQEHHFKPSANVEIIRQLLTNVRKGYRYFEDPAREKEVAYLIEALPAKKSSQP